MNRPVAERDDLHATRTAINKVARKAGVFLSPDLARVILIALREGQMIGMATSYPEGIADCLDVARRKLSGPPKRN